jgi:hypothetical protein
MSYSLAIGPSGSGLGAVPIGRTSGGIHAVVVSCCVLSGYVSV